MRIRKFILFIIVTVVLIVSSLPISFSAFVAPSNITSPLIEPVPSSTTSNSVKTSVYYVIVYLNGGIGQWSQFNGKYLLFRHEIKCPSSTDFVIANWSQDAGFPIFSNNQNIEWKFSVFDIESGVLLSDVDNSNISVVSYNRGPYSNNYRVNFTGFSYFPFGSARYFINGDIELYGTSGTYTVEPFVTWGAVEPEHNQYHSSLSEPVADQYNSYAVINNGLYWLSYKVNALYSYDQNIEVESSVYSGSGDIDSSGTGTYAGQNNGFTESFTVSGDILGTITSGGTRDDLIGGFESQESGNIDYTGVENGSVHLNSDGSYTYNDLEVYPVSFNNKLVSTMFSVVLVVEDQKNFKMRIIPNNSQLSGMICDIDLYASSFMLETGEYVGSFANNYTGIVNYCGAEYSLSGDQTISDVRMYGCEFYNPNNIPCHLASVLWQYDIDFADWRSRMEQQLIVIYSALRGEDVETETYTQPSWDSDLSQAEPATRISNEEMQSVFSAGLDDVRPSPEAQLSITGWVNMFAIPKLIAACCFALAMGTIILTLGKKKSD